MEEAKIMIQTKPKVDLFEEISPTAYMNMP